MLQSAIKPKSSSSLKQLQLGLLFCCLAMPALAHSLSAMWPAARYAGGFVGEPLADSDFEKREAFPTLFMNGQQMKRASLPEWSLDVPVVALAGAKERRAPFSAEEDRWMKAMDNLRKPRFG